MRFALSILCLVGAISNAQEQFPSLADGKRCLAELGGVNKRCWKLKSVQPVGISYTSADVKFTKIRLVEIGGTAQSFVIGIEWEGNGAGTLSISGPKGTLYAVGYVSSGTDHAIHIDEFADASLSMFDRGVLFGESDPRIVKLKTLEWLNEVVAPFVETYVLNPPPGHELDRP